MSVATIPALLLMRAAPRTDPLPAFIIEFRWG